MYFSEQTRFSKITIGGLSSVVSSGYGNSVGVTVRYDGTILYVAEGGGNLCQINLSTSVKSCSGINYVFQIWLDPAQAFLYGGSDGGNFIYKIDVSTWAVTSYGKSCKFCLDSSYCNLKFLFKLRALTMDI